MSIQKKVFERVLNMAQMHNIGVLERGPDMVWTCRWNEEGRESSVCYQLLCSPRDKSLSLRLRYRMLDAPLTEDPVLDYSVPMRVSLSYKRKIWYWFVCPLVINGAPCNRRVRNLYFLPSSNYFGCKHCRDLVLRSLPPRDQFVFRHTRFLSMDGAPGALPGAPTPELNLGWRPAAGRSMCHACGCLSEGAFCSHCGKPLREAPETFFELLGVQVGASFEEIQIAFKIRLKEYHPDRVATLGPKIREVAEQEIKQINLAYETLRDPEKRDAYLREITRKEMVN